MAPPHELIAAPVEKSRLKDLVEASAINGKHIPNPPMTYKAVNFGVVTRMLSPLIGEASLSTANKI